MTSKLISDVRDFMLVMQQEIPEKLSSKDMKLSFRLVTEEHREFLDAFDSLDYKIASGQDEEAITEAYANLIDAHIDSIYVHIGALLRLGCNVQAHWNEVQRANMSKFYGGIKKDEHGKVLKPEGWTGPDHISILNYREP